MEVVAAIITGMASIIVAIIAGRYAEKTARIKENKDTELSGLKVQASDSQYLSAGKLTVAIILVSLLACGASWAIGFVANSALFTDFTERTISVYEDTLDSAFTGLIVGIFFFVLGIFVVRLGFLSRKKKE